MSFRGRGRGRGGGGGGGFQDRNACTIFARNLSYNVTEDLLWDAFSSAKEIRLPLGDDGNPRGIAFIKFHNDGDFQQALKDGQNKNIAGKSIILKDANDKDNGSGTARGGRGGGDRGRGGDRGGRGRGRGRGGFNRYEDQGPPDEVMEIGTFWQPCEDDAVCRCTNEKVPYFNAPIYLENKTQIGKIDEIFGPIRDFYFSVKLSEGMKAKSFNTDTKIDPAKLLPLQRFLPGAQQRGGGRGGRGGGRGGRGGFRGGRGGRGGGFRGGRGGGRGGRGGRGGFRGRR